MSYLARYDGFCLDCQEPITANDTWVTWCVGWENMIHEECERAHHTLDDKGRPVRLIGHAGACRVIT